MELYTAIKNRRSHRLFNPDPVPKAVLERVIEAALWAPSGMNLQPWELTLLAGAKKDEFVALCSKALDYLMPKFRELLPEKQQKQGSQFFKDLGGAPVVIAATVWHDPEPFNQEFIVQSGGALVPSA